MQTTSKRRAHVRLAALFALCIGPCGALPADNDAQRGQLAALIRQLDLLDHQANYAAMLSPEEHSRYHFDHVRLHEDITHIRNGISDYLTPSRAQPRDSAPLSGHYREELSATETTP